MNRRKLLLLSGSSALAIALGMQAKAAMSAPDYSHIPIGRIEYIETVFDTLEDYRFGQLGKTRLFGILSSVTPTLAKLRHAVLTLAIDLDNLQMWARIEYLAAIRQLLDRRFGERNINEHLRWLASNQPIPGYTCRDMMESGSVADLRHVASFAWDKLA